MRTHDTYLPEINRKSPQLESNAGHKEGAVGQNKKDNGQITYIQSLHIKTSNRSCKPSNFLVLENLTALSLVLG